MDVIKIIFLLIVLLIAVGVGLFIIIIAWSFLPAIVGLVAGVTMIIEDHSNIGVIIILTGFILNPIWMDKWMDFPIRIWDGIKEDNRKAKERIENQRLLAIKRQEEEKRAQEILVQQEQRQKMEEQRKKEELNFILTRSVEAQKEIPSILRTALRHMRNAVTEYKEGAFTPFWDEVEFATKEIAKCNQSLANIKQNLSRYQALAREIDAETPKFILPSHSIPDPRPYAVKLQQIVRKAQKNYHFASIYEQRKTNAILIEGFSTFGSALYEINSTISNSLSELSGALSMSMEDLVISTKRETKNIIGQLEGNSQILASQLEQAYEESKARRKNEDISNERQKRIEKSLDNIQRGKHPDFPLDNL